MSGFFAAVVWVMNREGSRTGIRWKLASVLEDLDFVTTSPYCHLDMLT